MARWRKGESGNPGGRPKLTPDYEGVRALAREHAADAIKVLVEIMQDDTAPPSARASAAEAVLARGWGKPETIIALSTQPIVDYRDIINGVAQRLRADTAPAVPAAIEDISDT